MPTKKPKERPKNENNFSPASSTENKINPRDCSLELLTFLSKNKKCKLKSKGERKRKQSSHHEHGKPSQR